MTNRGLVPAGRLVFAACLVLVLSGCPLLPAGDPGTTGAVWNRTENQIQVRTGTGTSHKCYRLGPGAIGEIYSLVGDLASAPEITIYDLTGSPLKSIRPSFASSLVIVDPSEATQVQLRYRRGQLPQQDLVYDMPAFPEIDGRDRVLAMPESDLC